MDILIEQGVALFTVTDIQHDVYICTINFYPSLCGFMKIGIFVLLKILLELVNELNCDFCNKYVKIQDRNHYCYYSFMFGENIHIHV